jgi:hypothetical protein
VYHDDLAFLRFPDPAPKTPFIPLRPSVEDEEERLFLSYLFPELAPWRAILRRLRLPLDRAANCAALARGNGTDFQSELLVSGLVDEDGFYRANTCPRSTRRGWSSANSMRCPSCGGAPGTFPCAWPGGTGRRSSSSRRRGSAPTGCGRCSLRVRPSPAGCG